MHTCRQFYKVKDIRLPELLENKYEADGSFRKLIQKYKRIDLLIIGNTSSSHRNRFKSFQWLPLFTSRIKYGFSSHSLAHLFADDDLKLRTSGI